MYNVETIMEIGTVINERYELISEIGQGGMGVVYRAHDETLKRDVAIKVLSNIHLDAENRELLLREAQVTANLNHPNIVTVFDAGEFEETPFIIMELVEGQTLNEIPVQDMQWVADIACQICRALVHAHDQQLIHRDLKPENVALAVDGVAKLMDFGLARSMTSRLTEDGLIHGTVFYMAPEQAMAGKFDERVDLYAFGVMLYELTTGEIPFSADDPVAVISQHLHAPVIPPRAKVETVPPVLNDLILQLLRKDPDERPSSAQIVLNILEAPDVLDLDIIPSDRLTVLDRIVRGRMVGRKDELNEARAILNKVRAGDGQLLLVSGEAGVGKSRFMREIATQVEIWGGEVLVGECHSEGMIPYMPFMQIIRRAFRKYSDISNDLPDPVFADLLSLVPELSTDYPHVRPNPELEPEAEQRRLFENMVKFLTILCSRSPLLMVIEDIHWADSSSLHLLQLLTRRMRKKPLMLLGTSREIEKEGNKVLQDVLLDLSRKGLSTTMQLEPLSQDDTHDLIEIIFDDGITSEFVEAISHETEGNPFYIEEICKALIDTGEIAYIDGIWSRPEGEVGKPLPVPKGAEVAIQSRVNQLTDDTQELLLYSAIVGRDFDYSVLKTISKKKEDALIKNLEEALKAQLIEEIPEMRGELFSFSHALIPVVMRESVSGLRRKRIHNEIAMAIEALRPDDFERLAHHWDEVGDEERALSYILKSAERARQSFANTEALNYLNRALEITPESDLDGRFKLLMTREKVNDLLGLRNEQRNDLSTCEALAELESNNEKKAEVALRKANIAVATAEYDRALVLVQDAIAFAIDAVAVESEAQGYLIWGRVLFRQAYYPDALNKLQQALSLARSSQMLKLEADTLRVIGIISLRTGDFSKGRSVLEESLRISREIEDPNGESRTLTNLGTIANNQGDYESAQNYFENALRSFRQLGDRNAESILLINLGLMFFNIRDLKNARQYNEEALDLVIEMENRVGEGNALLNLGAISSVEGNYTSTRTYNEKALAVFREIGDRSADCYPISNLGENALSQGDFNEAQRLLKKALELSREFGEYRAETLALLNLVLWGIYVGNLEEAQAFCETAMEVIQKNELADFKGSAYTCMGAILEEKNQYEEAADHYEQAVSITKNMGIEYQVVNPLARLASIKLMQQDLEQAFLHVEEILAFLDSHPPSAEYDIYSYLICYRVLHAANDPRGDEFLQTAYRLLQARAEKISDDALRKSFLENIPHNREIVSVWKERFHSQSK